MVKADHDFYDIATLQDDPDPAMSKPPPTAQHFRERDI
jgi:hypothetical protein